MRVGIVLIQIISRHRRLESSVSRNPSHRRRRRLCRMEDSILPLNAHSRHPRVLQVRRIAWFVYSDSYLHQRTEWLTYSTLQFLDVWMPVGASTKKPLPVLANWYGGGYVAGKKEFAGSPVALWKAGAPPFVYVAPNYRYLLPRSNSSISSRY